MRRLIQKLKIILNSNIFFLILLLVTLITVIYKINNINSKYDLNTKKIIGIVTDIKKEDLKVTFTIKSKENVIVHSYEYLDINLGDKVEVIGPLNKLKSNTNFNLFNYKKYMFSKNTYYYINSSDINIIKSNKNILYKIKNYLINKINKIEKSEYLHAFILGDNSYIDENIKSTYRLNGISHLFSVSGMHITLLSSIILYILNKIKKSNLNYLFVILFLIFYMFLTNFTPSVIRATSLFIFLVLNKILNLNLSTLKILLIILCFNLILNPYNIYNTGFKFSYIISIYLILFNKLINKQRNYLSKTLITSLISFLSGIPILINNYFSINIMTILNNIIFVPLVSIIIFPVSLIVLFFPKIELIYSYLINVLENISLFISNFKIELILCHVNVIIIILYYFIITLVLYKMCKKKYKYIILLVILLLVHTNINKLNNDSYVNFLDVGQGDSSLIHLPFDKGDILIDTGGIYNYDISLDIINYLKSEGIKDIDYLVLTHADFDHIGSSISLVNNFKIKNVIFNCGEYESLEKDLINLLDSKKISYYSCISEINIDKYKLYFLKTKVYDNENDNSNIIYFNYNGYKFLFMGDASKDVEENLIKKYNINNIDVLKVGHHGSKTSSSKKFIDNITPKYSIISVGINNRYGHPSDIVLDNLKSTKIYRTDLNGSIMFKIKNNKLKIKTCIS